MKKFAIYAFALLATATTLTSCGDDEETTPAAPAVEAYSAKLLGAQQASAGSFFSTTTGMVYLTSDSANFATNNVNISFAQTGSTTLTAKFISLDTRRSENLTRVVTNNTATFFRESTLTKAQFDTAAASIGKISAASAKTINVTQGKVYEVVTVGSTTSRALVYVSNLVAPATSATGTVTIDVRRLK